MLNFIFRLTGDCRRWSHLLWANKRKNDKNHRHTYTHIYTQQQPQKCLFISLQCRTTITHFPAIKKCGMKMNEMNFHRSETSANIWTTANALVIRTLAQKDILTRTHRDADDSSRRAVSNHGYHKVSLIKISNGYRNDMRMGNGMGIYENCVIGMLPRQRSTFNWCNKFRFLSHRTHFNATNLILSQRRKCIWRRHL